MEPLEDALTGIAAFDAAVGVVPVVQQSQVEGGMCLARLTAQQGIGAIEQSAVVTGTDGTAVDAVAFVVGHGGVDAQGDGAVLVVGLQFLSGNVDGRRLLVAHYLGSVDGLVAQPQLMTILG